MVLGRVVALAFVRQELHSMIPTLRVRLAPVPNTKQGSSAGTEAGPLGALAPQAPAHRLAPAKKLFQKYTGGIFKIPPVFHLTVVKNILLNAGHCCPNASLFFFSRHAQKPCIHVGHVLPDKGKDLFNVRRSLTYKQQLSYLFSLSFYQWVVSGYAIFKCRSGST